MPTKPQSLFGKFLVWRIKHLSHRQFLLILSVVVGLGSGFVAVILKNTVHFIQHLLTSGMVSHLHQLFYFAFPVIGIFLTVLLVRHIFKTPLGDGIPSTLYAISRKNGIIEPFRMYASLITSALTTGFGGSVGLEGPTVATGSAIGSNLGRAMHLNYKSRILLICCATSAALSSILNAPISAIIFAIEIFSLDLTLTSLVPLLLASASGALASMFFQNDGFLFPYKITEPFLLSEVPYYLLLAVLCAGTSVYFSRVFGSAEIFFERFRNPYSRVLIGGLALGLMIYLIPPLYGEGYETINNLINGRYEDVIAGSVLLSYLNDNYLVLLLLLGLVLFKVFATSFTFGAGGVGGVFAPTLFMGSALGFVFSKSINQFGLGNIPQSSFTLVGMAGLLAGVLHAPLTAIFLIAEVTGGYELFLPLMLTSAVSYTIVKAIDPQPIYARQLAKKGDIITHNKDQAVLTLLKLDKVIEDDFNITVPEMSLGELVKIVSGSKRNLFPVLNSKGDLLGVLTLDDFRHIMFDTSQYEQVKVSDLMSDPPSVIQKHESMDSVMQKFQQSGAWNLPVAEGSRYIGFVSKSKLFSVYRRKLIEFSGE